MLTLPHDAMKKYPELDSSTERISISPGEEPHIAVAGILVVIDDCGDDQQEPKISTGSADLLLNSIRTGLLSEAGFLSVNLHGDMLDTLICGLPAASSCVDQVIKEYELPDHWVHPAFNEQLNKDGFTYLALVIGKVERTRGERTVTWGVAGGYGGAAPAFTTETEDIHRFNIHARVYDIETGQLVSDASVADEETGSHGVMAVLMPYSIRVDEDAYIETIGLRIGEELGRRFMRGKAYH